MEGLDESKELVLKYLRGIWKYRWIGVGIAWIVLVAGILHVDRIKNRYTAETQIYIDSSSLLKPLLKGITVESDLDAAVQLMVRQLLSRPNLERIVRLADLDLKVGNANQMEAMINRIHNKIKITPPERGRRGSSSNIYTISYSDTDRDRAKRIVQIILDLFVEDTLGKTGTESDSAIEFLDVQIDKYEALLREAEERREEFKRKNVGLMPKDGASYYGQLQQENRLLEQATLSLAESENRRDQIKQQITELISNDSEPQAMVKTSLDLRIEDQEGRIDELLLLYTEEHPDVINARRVLESLKERKQAELSETQNTDQGLIGKNPVYQELQILLAGTEADISSLNTRVESMEKKQKDLKRLIDIVPKIESDLERLNRDYEVHKKNYNELVARREKARISEDVEAGSEQVKFRIIEPPFTPRRPYYPDRPLFDTGVLLLALGIGYGVSLIISFFKPVFFNHNDIRNVMTTPILGSIKKFDTPDVLSKRRRNLLLFSLINVLLVCTAGYLIFLHSKDVVIIDGIKGGIKDLVLYLDRIKGQVS